MNQDNEEVPVRGVIMELVYEPARLDASEDREVWSCDYPSLPDFCAAVEALPEFQAAVNNRPLSTSVSSQEI